MKSQKSLAKFALKAALATVRPGDGVNALTSTVISLMGSTGTFTDERGVERRDYAGNQLLKLWTILRERGLFEVEGIFPIGENA